MDHRKPPALTSPWKIGFLVSLLLITMSIGVAFFMSWTFGLKWTWIDFPGGDISAFQFNPDAFMREMLPLVLLVPVLALVSYFLITGAVRKYKRYLDSGLDYKNLMQTLETIDDLNDGKSLEKLGKYPELRDFLKNTGKRIQDKEASFEKRERDLQDKQELVDRADVLTREADDAAKALSKGKEAQVSDPALTRILDAVETSGSAPDTTHIRRAADDAFSALTRQFREIATGLAAMSSSTGSASSEPVDADDAKLSFQRLQDVSGALKEISAATKNMAISAALEAGQDSGNTKLVKFADEARDIAARFNTMAERCDEVVTHASQSLHSMTESAGQGDTNVAQEAAELNKSYTQAMEAYAEAVSELQGRLGGETNRAVFEVVDSAPAASVSGSDDGFERQGNRHNIFNEPEEIDGLEKQQGIFEEMSSGDDDSMFADIPDDNVADQPVAEELPAEPSSPADDMFEEMLDPAAAFASDNRDEPQPGAMDFPSPEPAAEEPAQAAVAPEASAEPKPSAPMPGELELESAAEASGFGKVPEPAENSSLSDDIASAFAAADNQEPIVDEAPAKPAGAKPESAAAAEQPHANDAAVDVAVEEAVDLYALGAVDYEPDNAQHV